MTLTLAEAKTTKEDTRATLMSSFPEKEITDLNLSLDCWNNPVKTQTLHNPECVGPMMITECATSDTLYLSRRCLKDVNGFLKTTTLKNLYLEGNEISSLPDTLFTNLPNLVWLDLRNNLITFLPAEIGVHRCLKTLLLEGNPITELPLELGNVVSLKALSLRYCPITFPPQEVLQEGLQCILQYLRRAMADRPVTVQSSHLDMPLVEKLHLADLVKSSMDLCEDVVDEDELQRFRELREKMIQLDRADFDFALPVSRLPTTSESIRGHKTNTLPAIKRKEITSGNLFPKLPPFDIPRWKRSEEGRLAPLKELKEKQAILEERRKNQELLKEWRGHAKVMQERNILEHKQDRLERPLKVEITMKAPYATDCLCSVAECGEVRTHNIPPKRVQTQTSFLSHKEHEEARVARDRELEQRIRSHVKMMQERRRRPRGSAQEETEAARLDMEEAERLQSELNEQKLEADTEYRFLAFTG
ncbi:hypothetical protein UPYG_G00321880 [Umbra pygmaea]|uniref:Leucine-rich repeat-containing protein 27 n=1 Tax=Umbra pygmaea TaxID=75934 RepID=A0ABD0W0N0_UMBPY